MFRGYRFLVAATCGLILVVALGTGAFFGSLYSPDHKQYQAVAGQQSGQNNYNGPSQSLPDISGLPGLFERAIANPHPSTGADHEKRELAAQEASALWAFWMVVASFISVLITALGTALLYKQIVLTRKAVEDTGKATDAMLEGNHISSENLAFNKATDERNAELAYLQNRAYMHAGDVKFRPNDNIDPQHVVEIFWENHGKTPALKVGVVTSVRVLPPDGDVFGAFADVPEIDRAYGRSIAQGHPTIGTNDPPISPHDFFAAMHKLCRIFIFSRIEYDDVIYGYPHVTQECWEIAINQMGPVATGGGVSVGTFFVHVPGFYIST